MSIWIQITAGRGPSECCLVVARFSKYLEELAAISASEIHQLEQIAGDEPGTFQSTLYTLDEDEVPEWLKPCLGTVQWICKSPFRPTHKRKNWFIAVRILEQAEAASWSSNDVRIDTFRSSGPGGQHVNKSDSAVRATHVPSGLVAIAQEARSQQENRRLALQRLQRKLQHEAERVKTNGRTALWKNHSELERGDAVMVFSGVKFKRTQ